MSAITRAVALCAIANRANDALFSTAGTVEKAGTGRDDVLLAWMTTNGNEKDLITQACVADKSCNHAMHGCLWMRCRSTSKSLGTASISCLSFWWLTLSDGIDQTSPLSKATGQIKRPLNNRESTVLNSK